MLFDFQILKSPNLQILRCCIQIKFLRTFVSIFYYSLSVFHYIAMSIEVNHITKVYGTQKAVDNISFQIAKGEIVGLLGPNGAGKSTTMKILTCFIPPTSGSAKVCGYDILENPIEVRKKIGYLPEHNPLYLEMYVKEFLEFIGGIYHLDKKTLPKRVAEMIELTGLGKEQAKKIGELSKGYRQRMGIAQALIHNPEVLILDEPTSGLDPNQLQEIRNLIKTVGKEKTVILSTHIMQEVEAICDRCIIINNGKIVMDNDIQNISKGAVTQNRFFVEFETSVDENVLKNIPGVLKLAKVSGNAFSIDAETGKDIRQEIFKLSQEKNWIILTIRKEEERLEKVFQKLTK